MTVVRLADAPSLGRVDLGYGDRPLADVLDDVDAWSAHPVGGIFFDRAPADPPCLGAVVLAIRVARRAGLPHAVLNPGGPADPLYRALGARLCTFDGDWSAYQRWSGDGSLPGDGHLVYGVPPAQLPAARRLMTFRGAGFGLVTDVSKGTLLGKVPSLTPDRP